MEDEILFIGSSRIRGLAWTTRPGFTIKIVSRSGLNHQDLIKVADENIAPNTKILILVGLQVELHSRVQNENGQKGFVYANPTPPMDAIVSRLSCADLRWKRRGIHTVWVAPYTPNLVLLNELKKKKMKWGNHLMFYEKEMCKHWMTEIDANRRKINHMMETRCMKVVQLQILSWHLTETANSDGLHLGYEQKNELFGHVISAAIEIYRTGPPKPQEVDLPLDPELREQMNEVRRHKRKMRKTRAAERAIYETTANEHAISLKTGTA